jgi:hypothetical protein
MKISALPMSIADWSQVTLSEWSAQNPGKWVLPLVTVSFNVTDMSLGCVVSCWNSTGKTGDATSISTSRVSIVDIYTLMLNEASMCGN